MIFPRNTENTSTSDFFQGQLILVENSRFFFSKMALLMSFCCKCQISTRQMFHVLSYTFAKHNISPSEYWEIYKL